MGTPITDTSLMRYSSETQLREVEQLVKEADNILKNSNIGKYIAGGAIAISAAATVLGAGLAIPLGPLIVGGTLVKVIANIANSGTKKLINEKLALYKKAVSKQNAIIKVLKDERVHDKESIANLTYVNQQLTSAIENLQYDLGIN